MSPRINLLGREFARLKVIALNPIRAKNNKARWDCTCSCGSGKISTVVSTDLLSGNSKSCGCWQAEARILAHTKHGYARKGKVSKLYCIWLGLKQRCSNKNSDAYSNYGGRGVTVCEKWKTFEGFLEDMGESYKEGLTLERNDVNGNYCEENCSWKTKTDQTRNKTNTIWVIINGERLCLGEAVRKYDTLGLGYTLIRERIVKRKWSAEKAFETVRHGSWKQKGRLNKVNFT